MKQMSISQLVGSFLPLVLCPKWGPGLWVPQRGLAWVSSPEDTLKAAGGGCKAPVSLWEEN